MMRFFLILISVFFAQIALCQSALEAEALFNNKQYARAKNMYEALLKRKPNDALLNYRYARCSYEIKDYETAITHFELSGSKFPLKDAYLAEMYFQTYQFDLAILASQQYITTLAPDDKNIQFYERISKKAELGTRLLNRVEDIAIIDSAIVSKTDFLKAYSFNGELGTLNQQRIKLGKSVHDKIIFKTQRADRSCYSDSVKTNMDIFSSYKLLDEWTTPVTISKTINTGANENYPFLLPDGITLYYASDGENSLGGYDIFVTKYASSTKDYLASENIGFPFNSTANDYMMVIDELHKTGWFATDRNQQAGKVAVYSYTFNDPKRYFKSDDSLQVRNVAKLKSYKNAKLKARNELNKSNIRFETTKPNNNIVITDSILYNSPNQFQHFEAMQLYNESELMIAELMTYEKTLADARLAYIKAESSEKKLLEAQILSIEPTVLKLKNDIAAKKKQAVNKEIKFLFNK